MHRRLSRSWKHSRRWTPWPRRNHARDRGPARGVSQRSAPLRPLRLHAEPLGDCGGDDNRALYAYAVAATVDRGLAELLGRFSGAKPHLRLIARTTGIGDPFDPRMVEAYWIGNDLLSQVGARQLYHQAERFSKQLSGQARSWSSDSRRTWRLGIAALGLGVRTHNRPATAPAGTLYAPPPPARACHALSWPSRKRSARWAARAVPGESTSPKSKFLPGRSSR